MKNIKIKCPAKINLYLNVVSKRDDGYHNIETIMQKISIYDYIDVSVTESDNNLINLICNSCDVPDGEDNIVYKAATSYLQECKNKYIVKINLDKRIPVAAGLAGGSSDAAGVLFALDKTISEVSNTTLDRIAVKLGADVLFCMRSVCSVCRGIGELIYDIKPLDSKYDILVSIGKERIKTSYAYSLVDKYNDLKIKNDIDINNNLMSLMFNSFVEKVSYIYPEVKEQINILNKNGSLKSIMSGSGTSVFGIFDSRELLVNAHSELTAKGFTSYVSKPLNTIFDYLVY